MSISSNVVRKNIKLAFEENNETEKAFPKKIKQKKKKKYLMKI